MAVRNIFVFLCVLSVVYGFQSFQLQIPNGRKVMHPCNGGIPWPTVGHANYTHMKTKNLFGEDWLTSGFNWRTVCQLDSDGDGVKNGEELGDPNCNWEFGKEPDFEPTGHPGYCDQGRRQCSTSRRAIFAECRGLRFARRVPPSSAGRPAPPQHQGPPPIGNHHPQTHRQKGHVFGPPNNPSAFRSPSFPRFTQPRQPARQSFPRPMSGFRRMAGFSVFGTRPSMQQGIWQPSGGFRSGTVSTGASPSFSGRVFTGGRSPGFMGEASPSFLGAPARVPTFDTSGTRPTFPGSPHMGVLASRSGTVSRPIDGRFGMHFGGVPLGVPARTGGGMAPYPSPMTMPEAEGRIPMSPSSAPLLEAYRSRW